MRRSNSQAVSLIQRVLMTLVLRLMMNGGFSFDSSITCSELFRVSWVNLGYIAGDRRQNLKPKLAQVPEQRDFTYGVYFVAAEHLLPEAQVIALAVFGRLKTKSKSEVGALGALTIFRAIPFSFCSSGVSACRCEPLRAGCCGEEGVLGVS